MNRLILPAPLATLLVTRRPNPAWSDDELDDIDAAALFYGQPPVDHPMRAQWVTQPDDCPYVGERVEFVVAPLGALCPYCGKAHKRSEAFDLGGGLLHVECPCGIGFPIEDRVVGSGVVAESLPILAEGQDPYTAGVPIPPSGYVPHIAMSRDRLLWWKGRSETENLSMGRPTWVTADITDQRHGQDWTPGRWAWRITETVAS